MKLLSAFLLFSAPAFAAQSPISMYLCKIVSFDKTEAKGHCDPKNPQRIFKFPREWISFDGPMKVGQHVRIAVAEEDNRSWLATETKGKK